MKLYFVTLVGCGGIEGQRNYKKSYVVARDSNEAYQIVKKFLEKNDYFYRRDRLLEDIKLVASTEDEKDESNVPLFMCKDNKLGETISES